MVELWSKIIQCAAFKEHTRIVCVPTQYTHNICPSLWQVTGEIQLRHENLLVGNTWYHSAVGWRLSICAGTKSTRVSLQAIPTKHCCQAYWPHLRLSWYQKLNQVGLWHSEHGVSCMNSSLVMWVLTWDMRPIILIHLQPQMLKIRCLRALLQS